MKPRNLFLSLDMVKVLPYIHKLVLNERLFLLSMRSNIISKHYMYIEIRRIATGINRIFVD